MPSLKNTYLGDLIDHKVEGNLPVYINKRVVPALINEAKRAEILELSSFWYVANTGYVYTFVYDSNRTKRKIYLHRFLMNASESSEVDHINRNPLDNRTANLRIVCRSYNSQNKDIADNVSGFRGVSYHKQNKKWRSRLTVNGQCIAQTLHDTPQEAAVAYDNAAITFYGPDALTNTKLGLLAAEPRDNATSLRLVPEGVYGTGRLQS